MGCRVHEGFGLEGLGFWGLGVGLCQSTSNSRSMPLHMPRPHLPASPTRCQGLGGLERTLPLVVILRIWECTVGAFWGFREYGSLRFGPLGVVVCMSLRVGWGLGISLLVWVLAFLVILDVGFTTSSRVWD